MEVTDGEGSLHNSSCTPLIEMRMGNYEIYTEVLWKKFKRMTEKNDIGGDFDRKDSVSLTHFMKQK